jgi:hypothetical protein
MKHFIHETSFVKLDFFDSVLEMSNMFSNSYLSCFVTLYVYF